MKAIQKLKSNKGLSLVEVLLAVVILGLVAAPILQMFYSSFNMSLKSKRSLAAADLSQVVLEYISSCSYDNYQSNYDASLVKQGLKSYYIDNRELEVVPNGPRASAFSTITSISNGNQVTFQNVKYENYKYKVVITFTDSDVSGSKYFTYDATVSIYDENGAFYNSAKTTVQNKY